MLDIRRLLCFTFSLICLFFFQSCAMTVRGKNHHNGEFLKMENQPVQNSRNLIIHGEVKHMNRLDIDKSGRNPKYQISIHLVPTKIEGHEQDLSASSLIQFQAREKEILEQIDKLPDVGDYLIIETIATEEQLIILPIQKIKFKDNH